MKTAEEYFFDENGEERHFANTLDLISQDDIFFKHWFDQRRKLSVLDIGCGVAIPFYPLYHRFCFSKFIGVDNRTEAEISSLTYLKNIKKGSELYNKFNGIPRYIFDHYQAIYTPDKSEKSKLVSIEEFNRVFNGFFFNTPANRFLNANNDHFDLIILSNILHLICYTNKGPLPLEDAIFFFENIVKKLKNKGILYARIESRPTFNIDYFFNSISQKYVKEYEILVKFFTAINRHGDEVKTVKFFFIKRITT